MSIFGTGCEQKKNKNIGEGYIQNITRIPKINGFRIYFRDIKLPTFLVVENRMV